jgi:hypothetical protein
MAHGERRSSRRLCSIAALSWLAMLAGCAPAHDRPRFTQGPTPTPLAELAATPAPPSAAMLHATSLTRKVASAAATAQDDGDDDAGAEVMPDVEPLDHAAAPGGNDLTYPCQADSDCNFGACYVPGRGRDANPICSKRCDADADCPQGALCAAPLACQSASGPCVGRGYCFRACEDDAECTAINAVDTAPETDDTGNPVACVAWTNIHGTTPSELVAAPLDVCIQESEP